MIGKRTIYALFFCALSPGPAALAQTSLHQAFATCTGQLSAQLEHEWLMSDHSAERTEHLLHQFSDLLEATEPDTTWRDTLDLRIRAKFAHQAILTRATFNANKSDAAWAQKRANRTISRCKRLLPIG